MQNTTLKLSKLAKRSTLSRVLGSIVIATGLVMSGSAWAADKVNVRFSWKLKGEYAPFYYTEALGYFKEQDLDVTLGEGAGSPAVLGALLQGQEDVAIMPAIFALTAIQKGMPVKIISLYHPVAPIVMVSQPGDPVLEPKDMEGKSVGHAIGETGTTYLPTFCAVNNIDCGKIRRITMDSQMRVTQYIQGQVDMVSIYRSNDLPLLEAQMGTVPPTLDLGEYGLRVPGLAAVASAATIEKRGDVLRRYLEAVAKGMEATRSDPEAATQAILASWAGAPDAALVQKMVQATVDAVPPAGDKPLGWIETEAITEALALLASADSTLGTLKPAEEFFTNELLTE